MWLRKEENDPSWEKIIAALENMSEKSLASRLRRKYVMQHQDDPPVTTPTSGPDVHAALCKLELKVDRKDLVARELERLKEAHLRLKMRAESALESVNPSPRQLKRFSQEYMSSYYIEELFDCLEEFCFLDYALLKNINPFS